MKIPSPPVRQSVIARPDRQVEDLLLPRPEISVDEPQNPDSMEEMIERGED